MPGLFDFLGGIGSGISDLVSGVGDIFSGGGGGSTDITGGGGISDLLQGQNDWMSGLTDIGGTGINADLFGSTTPFDAITAGGFGSGTPTIDAASIFSDVPGLVNTPGILGSVGSLFTGGGGGGGPSSLSTIARSVLGGGAGGGGGGTPAGGTPRAGTPTPATGVPRTGIPGVGSTTPPAGGGGGGIGGVLGGLLNPNSLAALIPGVFSAITSKDQTDLGPDAAAMRALATQNQSTIGSLQAEAAAEKQGNLPGPAIASLERSLDEQRTAIRSAYAQSGMSGSSAEAADMAALNQKSEIDRFQIGLNMANEALGQVSGLTNQDVGIYQELMNAQTSRDNQYMQAMAELVQGIGKALGGPGGGTPGATGGGGLPPGLTSASIPGSDLTNLISLPDALTVPGAVTPVAPPDTTGLTIPALPDASTLDTSTPPPDPNALDPNFLSALQNDPSLISQMLSGFQ